MLERVHRRWEEKLKVTHGKRWESRANIDDSSYQDHGQSAFLVF
jgi:hypothetical protein